VKVDLIEHLDILKDVNPDTKEQELVKIVAESMEIDGAMLLNLFLCTFLSWKLA